MRNFLAETSPAHVAFYVSAIDGDRSYIMAGPYACHEAAKAQVPAIRAMAEAQNPRAVWMAFGTCGHGPEIEPRKTPLGAEWKAAA